MANPVEDEGWEEAVEELLEEGDEEEEEQQLPPGYRAADGPYRPFCTCQENITCSFCSWFHLIRECEVHGKATKRPPKPCYCNNKGTTELQAFSTVPTVTHISTTKSRLSDSRLFDPCECRKATIVAECNCLDDVISSSIDSAWRDDRPSGSGYDVSFDDVQGEDAIADVERVVDEEGETEDFIKSESDFPNFKNVSVHERQPIVQDNKTPRPCTCDEEPEPRSGSSTELESSAFDSSDTDPSSQYDLGLFDNLEGNSSSDITSSENSSAEGADIDWTRVRWIHNASDRSVESVSEGDYQERKMRRTAAKKLLARPKRRRHTVQKKTAGKSSRHQYLVVQQSRKKNFLEICKDKKDQPHSYSYHLMSII